MEIHGFSPFCRWLFRKPWKSFRWLSSAIWMIKPAFEAMTFSWQWRSCTSQLTRSFCVQKILGFPEAHLNSKVFVKSIPADAADVWSTPAVSELLTRMSILNWWLPWKVPWNLRRRQAVGTGWKCGVKTIHRRNKEARQYMEILYQSLTTYFQCVSVRSFCFILHFWGRGKRNPMGLGSIDCGSTVCFSQMDWNQQSEPLGKSAPTCSVQKLSNWLWVSFNIRIIIIIINRSFRCGLSLQRLWSTNNVRW